MRRTWTTTGEPLVELLGRASVEHEVEAMEWQPIPADGTLTVGFMPGHAINAVIRELELPKVTQVAISSFERPGLDGGDGFYPGFYGIEANYKNGRARVYVLDSGTEVTPLLSDFWPAELVGESIAADVREECAS